MVSFFLSIKFDSCLGLKILINITPDRFTRRYIKAAQIEPNLLACVPDLFKTQKICNETLRNKLHVLRHVLDDLKTQEMCDKAVDRNPWQLEYVPNHLKTQEMCNKVVGWHLYLLLEHIPDWFITQ